MTQSFPGRARTGEPHQDQREVVIARAGRVEVMRPPFRGRRQVLQVNRLAICTRGNQLRDPRQRLRHLEQAHRLETIQGRVQLIRPVASGKDRHRLVMLGERPAHPRRGSRDRVDPRDHFDWHVRVFLGQELPDVGGGAVQRRVAFRDRDHVPPGPALRGDLLRRGPVSGTVLIRAGGAHRAGQQHAHLLLGAHQVADDFPGAPAVGLRAGVVDQVRAPEHVDRLDGQQLRIARPDADCPESAHALILRLSAAGETVAGGGRRS
jgi:hypothetical protein